MSGRWMLVGVTLTDYGLILHDMCLITTASWPRFSKPADLFCVKRDALLGCLAPTVKEFTVQSSRCSAHLVITLTDDTLTFARHGRTMNRAGSRRQISKTVPSVARGKATLGLHLIVRHELFSGPSLD